MKKKSISKSAFCNLRVLIRTLVCLIAVALGMALYIGAFKAEGQTGPRLTVPTAKPPRGTCDWGVGADLPVAGIRFGGVFFPANGKFYAMGGRDLQTGGTEF